MRRHPDRFAVAAARLGYASRAVFKLSEVDASHHLFAPAQRVLDLGAAPGSWTQYAASRVGPQGSVLAVDSHWPSTGRAGALQLPAHAVRLSCDLFSWSPPAALHGTFHVVLCDAMSSTSGVRTVDAEASAALALRCLALAERLGADGCLCLVKLFTSALSADVVATFAARFRSVQQLKPAACRRQSKETLLLAKGKRPKTERQQTDRPTGGSGLSATTQPRTASSAQLPPQCRAVHSDG
jgi:23S rRNA (uridine2552-2'-O)-methyltransferase